MTRSLFGGGMLRSFLSHVAILMASPTEASISASSAPMAAKNTPLSRCSPAHHQRSPDLSTQARASVTIATLAQAVTIATPSQAIGVTNSDVNSQLDVTATPGATATPTHGEAVEPEASPTP